MSKQATPIHFTCPRCGHTGPSATSDNTPVTSVSRLAWRIRSLPKWAQRILSEQDAKLASERAGHERKIEALKQDSQLAMDSVRCSCRSEVEALKYELQRATYFPGRYAREKKDPILLERYASALELQVLRLKESLAISEGMRANEVTQVQVLRSALENPTKTGVQCEVCAAPAAHAEHFYDRVRVWCEAHTPWSGHFEYCGQNCVRLLNECNNASSSVR